MAAKKRQPTIADILDWRTLLRAAENAKSDEAKAIYEVGASIVKQLATLTSAIKGRPKR